MKKIIAFAAWVILSLMCLTCYAETNGAVKISFGSDVKEAKEVADGKGVSFSLPELADNDFYIYAIELAVFEKQNGETSWHIYTDENGNETKKKYIESPQSLNFNVSFGDVSGYREKAKYKIAYRYYVKSRSDSSKLTIAGEDVKDGWRLVGEENGKNATAKGFSFYKNENPTMNVECFSYKYHSIDGLMTNDCSVSELSSTSFPADAFENGVTVQMVANDFDTEDILTVSYKLEDAMSDEVVYEGAMPSDFCIKTLHKTKLFRLYITVSDNFGGNVTSEPFLFVIDTEKAEVVNEFFDGGFALRGKNLFSDFTITDDHNAAMTRGNAWAQIFRGSELVDTVELENRGNGIFRLDKQQMPDGEYTVWIKMYDKAGNESEHIFLQTLDNTVPTLRFIEPAENENATYYSRWMNVSKRIILDAADEIAGVKKYQANYKDAVKSSDVYNTGLKTKRIDFPVMDTVTGKLVYYIYVYDDAKTINKSANMYNVSSVGNRAYARKGVWLDKTEPSISVNHTDSGWMEAPYTVTASFYDYPSSPSVNDASGVSLKQYAITESENGTPDWKAYTNGVTFTDGGVYYLHFKATDNAGNVKTVTQRVRINSKAQVTGTIRPTEESKHTIYYSTPGFYVVKNTAYNTRYHFEVKDNDLSDILKTTIRLVSRDDASKYGGCESITRPNGEADRDVVFNLAYLDADSKELPDGVYDLYYTIVEVKNDGEEVVTHSDVKGCEVVIKRNAPPTPVITNDTGKVKIEYPNEPLAGSLNTDVIRSHYKYQYKAVKDGDISTNKYKTYTGEFTAENFIVTALYTDIAGNTSVATLRIHGNGEDGSDTDDNIVTDGDTVTVEESRAADVYYIGIRRDKNNGINNNVFDFLE